MRAVGCSAADGRRILPDARSTLEGTRTDRRIRHMKAPASEQRRLLDLQAADTRAAQLRHSLHALPQDARLAELEKASAAARQEFGAANGELEDAQLEITRVEADIATVAARETRDRARLQGSSSTKDIQGLEHELASLATRRDNLEDMELAVMERVETIEATIAGIAAWREELAAEERTLAAERGERVAELTRDLEVVESERAAIAGGLGAELLALYERQRERYGIGAALLRGGVSLGSNMALTSDDMATVRAAAEDDVVLCPDSNCILVRTEESGL
jgi:predicted  nucleic acid-binding Zn-ribbon protein